MTDVLTRADLLALTEDALVSLTNRGLYKRAAKEVAAGTGPTITADADAVRGTFPDGVVCALPPGGLEAAACTCGASAACRHVVAVVLAYQATTSAGDPNEFEQWSPAEFPDDQLEALLGKRTFTIARRRLATGYLARIHTPTPAEPVPWVELPNCSVRFLVPHDLAYARSDARDTKEAVALAVWAWRAWTERAGEVEDRHFAVGGVEARVGGGASAG
ncbi:SWIM zinc finger family protein, partial [Catenulispora sp. NL8]